MTIIKILKQIKTDRLDFLIEAQLQVIKMKKDRMPEGSLYVKLTLRDITGSYSHFQRQIKDDKELAEFEESFKLGDILHVRGEYQRAWNGILITRTEKLEVYDLNKFVKIPDLDAEELFSRIEKVIDDMENPWLKKLFEVIFEDNTVKKKFIACPSAVKYHHAYLHGNLEHTVGMLMAFSNYYLDFYGRDGMNFDVDLVNAGIILQDIGKIYEYDINNGVTIYVKKYGLIGHIVLGSELVAKKISSIPDFPEDLELKIKHIILSHHGRKEWGSPVEPGFPEAHIVHSLDLMDSRLKSLHK